MDEKGVKLKSLKENLDTNTSTEKLMLTMIRANNEFERANMIERLAPNERETPEINILLPHKYKIYYCRKYGGVNSG